MHVGGVFWGACVKGSLTNQNELLSRWHTDTPTKDASFLFLQKNVYISFSNVTGPLFLVCSPDFETPQWYLLTLYWFNIAFVVLFRPKIASRPAKMTIFVRNFDFAKNIEKPKENQCFWLPQPIQNRPKMAPRPPQDARSSSRLR